MRSFDANVTEVIEIVLTDQRAGALLENGWNITSIRTGFEEEDPNQKHIDVEFRNDELSLSFFIEVDEQERHATTGRCSAPLWFGGPGRGPLPEDYHQTIKKFTNRWYVFDHHNDRLVTVYNKTTIFYLYPSYGKEWLQAVEGLSD